MLVGEKIKRLIDASGKSVDDVASILGMSNQNLYKILKKESVELSLLYKLCSIFKVPITYFLDEPFGPPLINVEGKKNIAISGANNTVNDQQEPYGETALLREKVKNLEEINQVLRNQIEEKERTIQLLLKK